MKIEDIKYIASPVTRYAYVGWDPDLNIRDFYGSPEDLRKLRDAMSTPIGFDAQFPMIGEDAIETEQKRLLELRKAFHQKLKDMLKENPPEAIKAILAVKVSFPYKDGIETVGGREFAEARLACFEAEYMDEEGNYIVPTILGGTANRRGAVLLDAMAVQLCIARKELNNSKLQPEECRDRITTHISILVPNLPGYRFPNRGVRREALLRENHTKDTGFLRMSEAEDVKAFYDLVANHGYGQNDVRNTVGATKATYGVRIYFLCVIILYCVIHAAKRTLSAEERTKWKSIRLLERLCAAPYLNEKGQPSFDRGDKDRENPDHLPFALFSQKTLQGQEADGFPPMGLMCETDAKFEKENKRRAALSTPKAPMTRPTAQNMIDWIAKLKTDGKPVQRPQLKREVIQNYADRHDNNVVKDSMKAVDQATDDFLAKAKSRATAVNYPYNASPDVAERLTSLAIVMGELSEEIQMELLTKWVEEASELSAVAGETTADADDAVEAQS